jgi:hypothetical protein
MDTLMLLLLGFSSGFLFAKALYRSIEKDE